MSYEGTAEQVDLNQYPNAQTLVNSCKQFMKEVENL